MVTLHGLKHDPPDWAQWNEIERAFKEKHRRWLDEVLRIRVAVLKQHYDEELDKMYAELKAAGY